MKVRPKLQKVQGGGLTFAEWSCSKKPVVGCLYIYETNNRAIGNTNKKKTGWSRKKCARLVQDRYEGGAGVGKYQVQSGVP